MSATNSRYHRSSMPVINQPPKSGSIAVFYAVMESTVGIDARHLPPLQAMYNLQGSLNVLSRWYTGKINRKYINNFIR